MKPTDIVIYHNPECGTSRNVLGLIRNAGIEPRELLRASQRGAFSKEDGKPVVDELGNRVI